MGMTAADGPGCLGRPGLVGELAERGLQVDYRSAWDFIPQ